MTIKELYNWACENNVESYDIAYFDDGSRYYPSQYDLIIEPERLTVTV